MPSSFLADLLAEVIGSMKLDDVSIVYDPPRLPSKSLVNMNRRAMGMEDFQEPTFLKKERKEEKNNRWEGGLVRNIRSGPKRAVQDATSTKKPASRPGLGSRQRSDSMLLRPRRRSSSPNSPTPLQITRSASGPKLAVEDPVSTNKKPAATSRPGFGSRQDSMLLRPRRRPSSPNSPTQLFTGSSGPKLAVQDPVKDPASAKKPATRPGLGSRQCSDSMLLKPSRRPSSPNSPTQLFTAGRSGPKLAVQDPVQDPPSANKKPSTRPGLGSRQCSDSMLLRPKRRSSSPNSPTQLLTIRSGPKRAVQDPPSTNKKAATRPGLGNRQCSDSMLLRPSRRPSSPNSPTQLLTPRRRNGPKLAVQDPVQDPASTKKPATRPGLGSRQCSDSMLLRPKRRPSSPNSPTQLLMSEGHVGRTATRNIHHPCASSSMASPCVNEEVTSPEANGAAASKSMTREDRQRLNRHLREALVLCNAESGRLENNEEAGRHSLLQKQRSDSPSSPLAKPRREVRLLPLQKTAIKELEEDEISLVSMDSDEVASPSSQHLSDSALSVAERDLMSLPRPNAAVEDNEDIDEGSLLTMDLEADGIDYQEDENERSLSIQDIDTRCGSSGTEAQRLAQQSARSTVAATPQAETELNLSSARLFGGDFSMSLKSNSSEDETGLGNQTKFLARCNDSLLLLQHDEKTRNYYYDALLRHRALEEVRGKSIPEQVIGYLSADSTLDLSGCDDSTLDLSRCSSTENYEARPY